MKVVFFGTSPFAAHILGYLIEQKFQVCAVVTRADKPKGRSLVPSPSPVKQKVCDVQGGMPVYSPEKASTPEFAQVLKTHEPDLFVVVAYGEIIKQNLLEIPKLAAINIHASLLPKYRGAAPMQRALMAGEKETGITIIEMVLKMDAGPMIAREKCSISQEMTLGELEEKLLHLACQTIKTVLCQFEAGKVKTIAQDESQATFANKLVPEEFEIDWTRSATEIHNLIRAGSPKPAAWTPISFNGREKRLKIVRSRVVSDRSGPPGTLLEFEEGQWVVACGRDALQLQEVQLEGKKRMRVSDFLKGVQQRPTILTK